MNILLEDDDIKVLLPEKASTAGELVIIPNKKYIILEEVPDNILKKIFQISNKLASVLFETLKCEGTNVLIQNGISAGQVTDIVSVRIIPRFGSDNVNLNWEPRTGADLNGVMDILSGAEEKEIQENMVNQNKEEFEKKDDSDETDEDDYLAETYNRLP